MKKYEAWNDAIPSYTPAGTVDTALNDFHCRGGSYQAWASFGDSKPSQANRSGIFVCKYCSVKSYTNVGTCKHCGAPL